MSLMQRMRRWWRVYCGPDATPLESDAPAWVISMLLHVVLLLWLAAVTLVLPANPDEDLVLSTAVDLSEELPDAYRLSEEVTPQIGALGKSSRSETLAAAPLENDLALIATEVRPISEVGEKLVVPESDPLTAGPHVVPDQIVRGIATVGETGVLGAVDRITHEILLSLEQRPTLVVWMFDQSGSLQPQREAIEARFDRIYEELGVFEAAGNPAFARHDNKPLLTSVVAFASGVHFLQRNPTDDVDAIKDAVRSVREDPTGREHVFHAVTAAAERYRRYRTRARGPRNVLFVLFTDEAGDDLAHLERAVDLCRRQQIPVYVVGAPAPFGRENVYFKYVDPDPNFDQSPQWLPVHQGPESLLPERLKLRFAGMETFDEPIDSGFGPYGLTRLCYETGGLYFSVHPSRNRGRRMSRGRTPAMTTYLAKFFDVDRMRRYQPDYIPMDEYHARLAANRARAALVQAAQLSWTTPPENLRLAFPVRSEGELAAALTRAQQAVAVVERPLEMLCRILQQGESDRDAVTEPRWQAGFDLALGRALAVRVRTVGYNVMLARAKQGMTFQEQRSDTWVLAPADTVGGNSALAREADEARRYLTRVVDEHGGTPWAWLAQRELEIPLGWEWRERYTGVREPPNQVVSNAQRAMPRDERARTAPPQKPRRDPPAL